MISRPSHSARPLQGFTLIELLVVVAIISLLVSILLPTLTKAKELAKTAICLANVRTIGVIGLQFYAQENNGLIPPDYPGFWPDMAMNWAVQLGPYIGLPPYSGNSSIGDPYKLSGSGLECPNALSFLETMNSEIRPRFQGGYGINVLLDLVTDPANGRWNSPWNRKFASPPNLEQLAGDLVYLGDAKLFPLWNAVGVLVARDDIEDMFHYPDYRHNDQNAANFAYIDGHVQTVNYENRYNELRFFP
jgi:prepilin-type N-terminal cleavage/methylation domain-containing protein/prepilin-type processing-associated H-X9-DG protein